MQIYGCMNECKNEYIGNVMLRMNIWGMNMGMLGIFDRCKYMNVWNEC